MATYYINNATDLANITADLSGDYILNQDVSLSGVTWSPVFNFAGTFNGQGYTIRNLSMLGVNAFGLFGSVIGSAHIYDLKLDNFSFTHSLSSNYAALALEVYSSARVTRCVATNVSIVSLAVTNTINGGGLVGFWYGTGVMTDCSATSTVDLAQIDNVSIGSIGGLAAEFKGAASNCSATMIVTIGKTATVSIEVSSLGGLFGTTTSGASVIGCDANVTLQFYGTTMGTLGGLIGFTGTSTTISKCFAVGSLIMSCDEVSNLGGLIGFCGDSSIITNCYTKVTISITDLQLAATVGGFMGFNFDNADVKNCYAASSITIASTELSTVGGFVADCEFSTSLLQNCYSVGVIISTGTVGGFLGIADGTNISNCSWYSSASTYAIGEYNSDAPSSLSALGFGTEEPDNTKFYRTTHAVYAQT